jgi:hypothetical protein
LDTEHLKRHRPSRKLDFKRIGPFEIIEKIHYNAFKLKFPDGSRLHDVINISRLTPFANSRNNCNSIEPEPDIIDEIEDFEIEEILDHKTYNTQQRN